MTGAEGARPKILLVDDERDILIALEDLLDQDYDLFTTTSPARALEILADEPDICLIVSDQRMPEMPGHVLLGQARAVSSAEAMLLTGYADMDAVISAVNEGRIGGYAHKPWEPDALRGMIAAAVERARLRRQLAFEQGLFSALLARSPDIVGVTDADGRVVRGDRRVQRADGLDADQAALASGTVGDEEVRDTAPDGQPRHRRIQRLPLTIEGKAYLLKIESDESERRLLQRQLQQAEKLTALGTLAGGIAHDFNNLLTAITGNLELAAGRPTDDARLARFIGNAQEAARRGTTLTARLLSFSHQGELIDRSIDPNRTVRGMRDLIERTAGGIALRYDLDSAAWFVRVDPDQLELALLNLAINAADAMPGGGEVRMVTRNVGLDTGAGGLAAGDYVTIAVADDGEGMAPDVAARVFEPFFTTKERGRGTGLGLPMVHALASNAGGRVALETAPGRGTTITIWLPRSAEHEDDAAPTVGGPLRVLLVEDEADVRAVSVATLRALGHEVAAVGSSEEALALYAREPVFDIVMTDFAMPGMTGAEMADEMARRWPDLPVLIVTGFAEASSRPAHARTLAKPFTRDALADALASAFAARTSG